MGVHGTRTFRKAGGMPPTDVQIFAKPPSGRYLNFAEREEIALLRVQGLSGRRQHAFGVRRARYVRILLNLQSDLVGNAKTIVAASNRDDA
jgi:hypothetical protein